MGWTSSVCPADPCPFHPCHVGRDTEVHQEPLCPPGLPLNREQSGRVQCDDGSAPSYSLRVTWSAFLLVESILPRLLPAQGDNCSPGLVFLIPGPFHKHTAPIRVSSHLLEGCSCPQGTLGSESSAVGPTISSVPRRHLVTCTFLD